MEDGRMISLNDYTAHDGRGLAELVARKVLQRVTSKRRGPMQHIAIGITIVIGLMALCVPVDAQSWQPPADDQRCPSKWGADDERGAANHMKPETVLRATQLIKSGEVIELAHVLSP